jgi:hypothetical protein
MSPREPDVRRFHLGMVRSLALAIAGVAVLAGFALPAALAAPIASLHPATAKPWCQVHLDLPTPICQVYVVFLENEEESNVLNNSSFMGHYLIPHYAFADQYYSVIHYSFPNYLAATAGFVTNYLHLMNRTNVVDLIKNHTPSLTWMAYMGGQAHNCSHNGSNHNPFVWYWDIWSNQSYCQAHDVPFHYWTNTLDSGHWPNYAFFSPAPSVDCWKYGLQSCDKWLHSWLTPLVNKTAFFAHSAFFITFDEGSVDDLQSSNGSTGGGHVATILVSPYACPGTVISTPYNHYDLLTTTEWLLGLGRIGNPAQDNWSQDPPMTNMFCFPAGTVGVGSAGTAVASVGSGAGLLVARPRGFSVLPS